jgi:acetyl-CoA decarbonylase/synthase complex subunit gamma
VAQVSAKLSWRDHLGSTGVRLGVGRDDYRVPAGLYAVGTPDADAPVLVTANYKLTYDQVRAALAGRSVWLLVLETFGINVWCAAGKGTFGTGELVRRIAATRLSEIVRHRRLILPLLGATGVAAHRVEAQSGFRPHFAGIRISDLPRYLDDGTKVRPEMRELTFSLRERLLLAPVELRGALRKALPFAAAAFLLGATGDGAFDWRAGLDPVIGLLGAILAGTVVVPLLLPWIPGPSFAGKGAIVGVIWAVVWGLWHRDEWGILPWLACLTLLPAVASFLALNFTGSTPFTSVSGVRRELRIGMPFLIGAVVVGLVAYGLRDLLG